MNELLNNIKKEYETLWGKASREIKPDVSADILKDFPELKILEFPPSRLHKNWIYATLGMSSIAANKDELPEVHIYASDNSSASIEAITSLMEYSQYKPLKFGDIFPCFKDNKKHSGCSYITLAYSECDGEGFKELFFDKKEVLFIWLLPITHNEKKLVEEKGLDALEDKLFEKSITDYSWDRKSIV